MTTKLEELKAAVDDAYANYAAAYWAEAAYDTYATADDAYVAYCEELKKQETSDD
jgi:hypothetical protein